MNAGSPAIDTGTSIGAPVDDFENDSRPTDGDANGTLVHDMGADEAKSGKGIIQGKKFDDLNDNGKLNSGEPGLAGWDIYHDANNNGVRDSAEVTDVTDSSGNYELKDLPAGLQCIREAQKSGWK